MPDHSPSNVNSPARPADARPFTRGTLHRLKGWRCLLFEVLWLAMRLYLATIRTSLPREDADAIARLPRPALFFIWHNRSLTVPVFMRSFIPPHTVACLISPSRMAAWEVAMFEKLGYQVTRGSSSRRSIAATRELLRAFRSGSDLALSPDGPAGPPYRFKRGFVMIARQTGGPIVAVSAHTRFAWRPKTWDRHLIPLPFSHIQLRCKVLPPYHQLPVENEKEAIAFLENAINHITEDYHHDPRQP